MPLATAQLAVLWATVWRVAAYGSCRRRAKRRAGQRAGHSKRGGWGQISVRDRPDGDDSQSTLLMLQALFAARAARWVHGWVAKSVCTGAGIVKSFFGVTQIGVRW